MTCDNFAHVTLVHPRTCTSLTYSSHWSLRHLWRKMASTVNRIHPSRSLVAVAHPVGNFSFLSLLTFSSLPFSRSPFRQVSALKVVASRQYMTISISKVAFSTARTSFTSVSTIVHIKLKSKSWESNKFDPFHARSHCLKRCYLFYSQ